MSSPRSVASVRCTLVLFLGKKGFLPSATLAASSFFHSALRFISVFFCCVLLTLVICAPRSRERAIESRLSLSLSLAGTHQQRLGLHQRLVLLALFIRQLVERLGSSAPRAQQLLDGALDLGQLVLPNPVATRQRKLASARPMGHRTSRRRRSCAGGGPRPARQPAHRSEDRAASALAQRQRQAMMRRTAPASISTHQRKLDRTGLVGNEVGSL